MRYYWYPLWVLEQTVNFGVGGWERLEIRMPDSPFDPLRIPSNEPVACLDGEIAISANRGHALALVLPHFYRPEA